MPQRRGRKRSACHRWRQRLKNWVHAGVACLGAASAAGRRLVQSRAAPHPRVVVVGDTAGSRTLVRIVTRAAHEYARALGVALPDETTIVLAPIVSDGGRLHGLLEVVAPVAAPRRAVLYLATGGEDQPGEALAALRLLVARLAEETTGAPVLIVPIRLATPDDAATALSRIIPLRPMGATHINGVLPAHGRAPEHRPGHRRWLDDDPA